MQFFYNFFAARISNQTTGDNIKYSINFYGTDYAVISIPDYYTYITSIYILDEHTEFARKMPVFQETQFAVTFTRETKQLFLQKMFIVGMQGAQFRLGMSFFRGNHCSYELTDELEQQSLVLRLFSNPDLYIQVPLYISSMLLLSIVITFCSHRFDDARNMLPFKKWPNKVLSASWASKNCCFQLVDDVIVMLKMALESMKANCSTWMNTCVYMIKETSQLSNSNLIKLYGSDSYYLCQFNLTMLLFCLFGCLFAAVLVPLDLTSTKHSYAMDVGGSTIASVYRYKIYENGTHKEYEHPEFARTIAHSLTIFFLPVGIFAIIIRLICISKTIGVSKKLQVLLLRNLDRDIVDNDQVVDILKTGYQIEGVLAAQVVLDLEPFVKHFEQRQKLNDYSNKIRTQKFKVRDYVVARGRKFPCFLHYLCCIDLLILVIFYCGGCDRHHSLLKYVSVDSIAVNDRTLASIENELNKMKSQSVKSIGSAFIVVDREACGKVIAKFNSKEKLEKLKKPLGHDIIVEESKPAYTVNPENLAYSKPNRICRAVASTIIICILVLLVTFVSGALTALWYIKDYQILKLAQIADLNVDTLIGPMPIFGKLFYMHNIQPLNSLWLIGEGFNRIADIIALVNVFLPGIIRIACMFVKPYKKSIRRAMYIQTNAFLMVC